MNQVSLVGRITRDLEVTTSQAGREVCRFTVAVNRQFKNSNGEYDADFISCVAFGQTANFMGRYLEKGRLISVTGRIQTGSYERDGQRIYTTDVIADSVQGLDSRRTENNNNNNAFGNSNGFNNQSQGFNNQNQGSNNSNNGFNNNQNANQGPGQFMQQQQNSGFNADAFNGSDDDLPF